MRTAICGLFLGLIVFAGSPFAAQPRGSETVRLSPHRAVYVLELGRTRAGGGVSGAKGRMVMEWEKSCAGWTVKQRFRLRISNSEGGSVDTDSNHSSFESLDGLTYRFTTRNTRNGRVTEDIEGNASLSSANGPGTADFKKPEGLRFDLPAGTLFPTRHVADLVSAARTGERFVSRTVFDGASEDGPLLVNAVLLAPMAKAPARWAGDRLTNRPSWHVRLAYFPLSSLKAEPDYELGLRLFDNGVADELELDYGTFTVKAKLQETKALALPKC